MQLDLVEEDYFGLQFMDKNQVPHWLDKTKKIKKQIQGMLCRISTIFTVFRIRGPRSNQGSAGFQSK